ncbi:MAG: gliding motility-associated ABC transporter substrate-binding protein GldG [Bacteroidia bacterium]
MTQKRGNKKRDIIWLVLSIAIVVLCNFIGSFVFHRFDLTSEKRYTLSDDTKKMMESVNDIVYVKVYLDGDFPSGFKRLKSETKEMLDEFRAYSHGNVQYEFINPSANPDTKVRDAFYRQLYNQGLTPTNLQVKDDNGGSSEQVIFPWAVISYKGQSAPVQLLQNDPGVPPDEALNNSVQKLEYDFASAMRILKNPVRREVGFLYGHGELDSLRVADITNTLNDFYVTKRVKIEGRLKSLQDIGLLIIANPDTIINEKDKFIIDQFVMHGGKILWLVNSVYTNMDSLHHSGITMGLPRELNLNDMLFNYGARINTDIVQDMQCSMIPINKAFRGSPPDWQLVPWVYTPLVGNNPQNIITKNLDLIEFNFASSLDTIGSEGIKKTFLLRTSKYSRLAETPTRVSLGIVEYPLAMQQFDKPFQPLAVLLEGKFKSLYTNRDIPKIVNDKEIDYKYQSPETKMIVIADGNVIKNEVQQSTGRALPLGYDFYTNRTYGNKNFILNCINYLTGDESLIPLRGREIKLRLLDKKKIANERLQWQIINTVLPSLLIIIYGMIQFFVRKRKYSL